MIEVVRLNASREVVEVSGATKEEMVALPRVSHSCGFRPKVLIEGKEYTLGYTFYTQEEKDGYREYDKAHRGTGTGTSTKSKLSEEDVKNFAALEEILKDNEEALKLLKAIKGRLEPKNSLVEEIFGVSNIASLTSRVTKAWVMYRGKDGIRGSNPETFTMKDAIEQFGEDLNCVMTKMQLEDKIAKLKAKGIIVDACFVD